MILLVFIQIVCIITVLLAVFSHVPYFIFLIVFFVLTAVFIV